MVSQLMNPEAVMHPSPNPSFDTAKTYGIEYVAILAWKAVLNDDS